MAIVAYEALPGRVIFGPDSLDRLAEEVDRLGLQRLLVLSTPGGRALAESVAARLGPRTAGLFDRAAMHVPVDVAADARARARALEAGGCVAVGGGSTIGLAKAIALALALPIVAIPTTYAGSEMTPIWGLTEGGQKTTGRDRRVLPQLVLYDPTLTLTLPPAVAGPSGMNALAHCAEALYAPDGNPIIALLAEEGARALAAALPVVVREPANLEARTQALYGAWLAGAALGAVSMGLHHKLCHTLGGSFGLPHAEVHAVILPHAIAYNAAAAPAAMTRLARALGTPTVAGGLAALARTAGAPTSLAALGLAAADLDRAADLATRQPYPNPAPITRPAIRRLLEAAYHGRPPDEQSAVSGQQSATSEQ